MGAKEETEKQKIKRQARNKRKKLNQLEWEASTPTRAITADRKATDHRNRIKAQKKAKNTGV